MADRTVRMYGKAYGTDVSVTAVFDGVTVHNGTVTSVDADPDLRVSWDSLDELCSFVIDTLSTGDKTFSLSVSGGDVIWHTFHSNYSGSVYQAIDGTDPVEYTLITATADNYNDLSTGTPVDDGHTNVVINDVVQTRNSLDETESKGTWNWLVEDSNTLTCNVFVSTAITTDTPPV